MATKGDELPLVQIDWQGIAPQAVPFAEEITGNSPWSYLLSPRVRFAIHSGGVPLQVLPNIREIDDGRWSHPLTQHLRFVDNDEDMSLPVFCVKIVLDQDGRLINGRRFSAINFAGSMRPFSMGQLMILVSPRAQGGKFWVNLFAQVRVWCERALESDSTDIRTVFSAN